MLTFAEYITEQTFVIEELLLENSADAMGKYHELMYIHHANGGKFMPDDPRKADAEAKKKELEKQLSPEVAKQISDKAKKSANEMNSWIAKNGHAHKGSYWSSQAGDIGKITGHNMSQKENAADVVSRIEDEHGNTRHMGVSLKHLGDSSGHAPTSNPGIGTLDKMLGTNSQPHLDKADKEIDKAYPQYAGKSRAEKKAASKTDDEYKNFAFSTKRVAIEKARNAHLDAFKKLNHGAQVAHIRELVHAHHTPDVPQIVVTSHKTGTRIENRADRYHPNNITAVSAEPHGWNSIKHTIHFKDGSSEEWHGRGKFESGPFSTLKGSFERRS
jgi:predicted phage tail protein